MSVNRRADQDRGSPAQSGQGQDTRARMIQAAIEVFGSLGYDGASTRQLAETAGVNQAAIPYHFGGKRELYLAAAQAIADYARSRIDPVIAALHAPDGADPTGRIDAAISSFFRILAGDEEPAAWTDFFVRCEREADDAFHIIHLQAVARFQSALIDAVAAATGAAPDTEDLKLRVAIVLGAVANFRTMRNVMLSSLGWDKLDADRMRQLETAIRRFALAELLGIQSDDRSCAAHLPRSLVEVGQPSPAQLSERSHHVEARSHPGLSGMDQTEAR
jgi:AcrR family transcriptional regulator